jgi:hypothetical protein
MTPLILRHRAVAAQPAIRRRARAVVHPRTTGQARSRSPRQDRRCAEDARPARHALAGQPGQPGARPSRPARRPSRGCGQTRARGPIQVRPHKRWSTAHRLPVAPPRAAVPPRRTSGTVTGFSCRPAPKPSLGDLPATVHTAGSYIGLHRSSHGLVGEDWDRPFVGRLHVHLYPRRPHCGQIPKSGFSVISNSFRGFLPRTILAIASDRSGRFTCLRDAAVIVALACCEAPRAVP